MLGTDDRIQPALELAYGYLNRRDRTQTEVRRRLERAGIESSAVEEVIRTLLEQRFLDDVRYARLFVEDKHELEQWGNDRIRRTLLERGISPELIDETLAAESSQTELERALELLRQRFPSPPRDRRDRDRALGMMVRKGYDSDLALDALSVYGRDPGPAEVH